MKQLLLYTMLLALPLAGCQHKGGTTSASPETVASRCDAEGTCSGDKYCTACKNCSRCRHCAKEGGTCRVCK